MFDVEVLEHHQMTCPYDFMKSGQCLFGDPRIVHLNREKKEGTKNQIMMQIQSIS